MSVYRVRPRDVADDVVSDEDFSDLEVEVSHDNLLEALDSRNNVGNDAKHDAAKTQSDDGDEATPKSWSSGDGSDSDEAISPGF